MAHIPVYTYLLEQLSLKNHRPETFPFGARKSIASKNAFLFLFGLSLPSPHRGQCDKSNHTVKNRSRRFFRNWFSSNIPDAPYKKSPPEKQGGFFYMARLEGFEPPTARFVAEYSIQLSYRRVSAEGVNYVEFLLPRQ